MALFPDEPAQRHARYAVRVASPWVERLARLGYAAKGVVYLIVGGLAARAAFGNGGQTTDSEGALATLLRQPLGQVLLGAVALGLAGYALWRFVQAAFDLEDRRTDVQGVATRIGYLISGIIHAGLAVEAARMVLGSGGGSGQGGGEEADHWTAMLMSQPFGVYLLGIVGAGITGFGLYQLYKAYEVKLSKRLDLSGMSSTAREWTILFGRFGLAARGVVFGIIGILLIQAALQLDPQDAVGVAGALRTLQQQPYGPWLLGTVALGLVAYGLFELVKARYHRIQPA